MKTWRIALVSGSVVAIGILLLFSYQYFILENTKMIEGMNEQFGSALLTMLGLSVFSMIFVMALVTFPVFLLASVPWFFMPTLSVSPKLKIALFNLVLSSVLVLLVLYVSMFVQKNYL